MSSWEVKVIDWRGRYNPGHDISELCNIFKKFGFTKSNMVLDV